MDDAETSATDRNHNTISPSAEMLLMTKGYTNIPFAKQAAELYLHPEKFSVNVSDKDLTFWARLAHFESRYWTIDQLLWELHPKNILEISSGFSFRGLQAVQENNVHYIDTDLTDVIDVKKRLLARLEEGISPQGTLETLPLNALDEAQFAETVGRFPQGEIVIVNEGLLMYLNTEEKQRLCGIIRNVLKQRGGYWITADIYIKKELDKNLFKIDKKMADFAKQHNVAENRFDSFEAADEFFRSMGFIIDKEAEPDYSQLTALKKVFETASEQQLQGLKETGKMQATWRLRPEDTPQPST